LLPSRSSDAHFWAFSHAFPSLTTSKPPSLFFPFENSPRLPSRWSIFFWPGLPIKPAFPHSQKDITELPGRSPLFALSPQLQIIMFLFYGPNFSPFPITLLDGGMTVNASAPLNIFRGGHLYPPYGPRYPLFVFMDTLPLPFNESFIASLSISQHKCQIIPPSFSTRAPSPPPTSHCSPLVICLCPGVQRA